MVTIFYFIILDFIALSHENPDRGKPKTHIFLMLVISRDRMKRKFSLRCPFADSRNLKAKAAVVMAVASMKYSPEIGWRSSDSGALKSLIAR